MKRREFIMLLGGAAVALPLVVRAQQPDRITRVGVLSGGDANDPMLQTFVGAFREGIQKLGWVDGRNIRIDYRWAAGDSSRIRAYAVELVAMTPDVIVSDNTPIVQELRRRTRTIPIVFVSLADPVESGVVASLGHPDGNTTGS